MAYLLQLAGIPDCVGPGGVTLVVEVGGFDMAKEDFEVLEGGFEVVKESFEVAEVALGPLMQ